MKMLAQLLIFLAFFSLYGDEPIVGGYIDKQFAFRKYEKRPPFSIDRIPPNLLTDLYFAFLSFENEKPVATESDKKIFQEMQALKGKNPELKLFLSVGGWGFNDPKDLIGANTYQLFSKMLETESSQKAFIESLFAFASHFGFNGIDLDWEYPGDLTRGGKEEDFERYLLFLKQMQERLNKNMLLSVAFPAAIPSGIPKKYRDEPSLFFKWIAKCAAYLDRVQLMAYDYHGPFNDPKLTGVNAPLKRDTNENSSLYVVKSLQNYLENGVPKEKILLGIPVYGHSFSGVQQMTQENFSPGKPFLSGSLPGISTATQGSLSYFEIADLIAENVLSFGQDPVTNTAIAYSLKKGDWVSFDTPETIQLKAKTASSMGLQGIFFWSIDQDEYQWPPIFPSISAGKKSLSDNS